MSELTPKSTEPEKPKRTQQDPLNEPKGPPIKEPPIREPSDPPDPADSANIDESAHEGATDDQAGNRAGPGAGYDEEPEKEKDTGGVAPS